MRSVVGKSVCPARVKHDLQRHWCRVVRLALPPWAPRGGQGAASAARRPHGESGRVRAQPTDPQHHLMACTGHICG